MWDYMVEATVSTGGEYPMEYPARVQVRADHAVDAVRRASDVMLSNAYHDGDSKATLVYVEAKRVTS